MFNKKYIHSLIFKKIKILTLKRGFMSSSYFSFSNLFEFLFFISGEKCFTSFSVGHVRREVKDVFFASWAGLSKCCLYLSFVISIHFRISGKDVASAAVLLSRFTKLTLMQGFARSILTTSW